MNDQVALSERLDVVFPGQGSQSVGMLSALSEHFSCVEATFAEGTDALGYDAWLLVQTGAKDALARTQVTQPVMLLAGVAVWRAWQIAGGPQPACAAGHSLGEYTALVAAGAITLQDAVRVVKERARLMQETVPEGHGAMAVFLGLSEEAVQEICEQVQPTGSVAPANFNAPGQVVVGGLKTAVDQAGALAKAKGCKRVVPVAMSVPSHCLLMEPAAQRLAPVLEALKIHAPRFPVLNNLTARPEVDPEKIRAALQAQIYNPVLWTQTIRNLLSGGCDTVVELGPGKVLTGLGKRIDRSGRFLGVENPTELNDCLEQCAALEV
ncbi:MAG: ACP S-malonyltransferase [Gammaproteobacteria bacterium]